MKIGVLLKQTPDTETKIKIKPDASGIDEADIKWVINPYDEYAVEEALRLKEAAGGGEVVIVTAGVPRAVESMRQALAMGADRAIRIDTEGVTLDNYLAAVCLARAAAKENFDLIFAGKQAVDDDCVQVAHGVAALLDWPCVWPAEHYELSGDKKVLTVTRPVAGGIKEIIEMTLPGMVCCDKGEHDPRYASLPGIMKAKSKPIAELKAKDLLGGETARVQFSNFSPPPERKAGKILKGELEEVCAELVKLLREEAKVI
ncbi:MAG: electron transfer flavoprotein subunit beta/FixA family protein [Deltaproteobacteria bacterium]|nr:electron transfer flavoprotein subunit beta/FixA family protein [Deltaproteobacteria bacterium]